MTITRDASVRPEIAELMSIFNRASDGYDTEIVLNASLNMLAAAIGFVARESGGTLEDAEAYAQTTAEALIVTVRENWNRERQPGDIEVKPQ